MVKKRVSLNIRPVIQTSATVEKKTFTKLDDYCDEKGISIVKLTDKIFLKKLETKLGKEKFKELIDNMWNLVQIELSKEKTSVSSLMEEGINEDL